jgi:hypothetical protein
MPMDCAESLGALLKAGAVVGAVDRDRRTPLHWASEKTAERCMRMLLEEGSAVVDAVDWGGYSALHSAARVGSLACVAILLEKGADPELVAANGETPRDLAEDPDVIKALAPPKPASDDGPPSMKRKRNLSANSAALEASLPTLAEAFYQVAAKGDLAAVRKLCTPDAARGVAAQVATVLAAKVRVGEMHVSARTMTAHVELRIDTSKAVHQLVFDDDGLIASSELFNEMAASYTPVPVGAGHGPPSG